MSGLISKPNPPGKSRLIRVCRNESVPVNAVQVINPEIVVATVAGFLTIITDQVIENEIDRATGLEPDQILFAKVIKVKRNRAVAILAGEEKCHFAALRCQAAASGPDIDNEIRLAVAVQIARKHLYLGAGHAVREGHRHQAQTLGVPEVNSPAIGGAA